MGQLPFERIKRDVVVRKETKTDHKYGKDPWSQTTDELLGRCIVVIDKPAGPTSHQTSDYLKKIIKIKKAGHSGTLDPGVTGVLPVAVGRGTRIVQTLLTSGKEYICEMHLHKPHTEEDIRKVCETFVGKIKQLPPVKSAVKRQWRFRKIYYLEILDIKGQDVLFKVGCQAGTYIRKLCHDIGEKLGGGAHMAELRRTKAGPFGEGDLATLQDVTDALHYAKEGDETRLRKILRPIEDGASHLAKIWIHDTTVDALCNGVSLKAPGISKVESEIQVDDPIAVFTLKNELVLVGRSNMTTKELVNNDKGVAVKTEQVFMSPGTYPRVTK